MKTIKRKMTIDMNEDRGTFYFAPVRMDAYSKMKIKIKNKKIVKASYKIDKELGKVIKMKPKKHGKTTVIINVYQGKRIAKRFKHTIRVIGKGKDGYRSQSKKAFEIQNEFRNAKGSADLQWSEELYQCALYRLRTSGFDAHKNLVRDMKAFFGDMVAMKGILLGENMAVGYTTPKEVMQGWKKSPGHYQNLLTADYQCGAIARYQNTWCALFYRGPASDFVGYKELNERLIRVTVKRFSKSTNAFVAGSSIEYFEKGNRYEMCKRKSVETEAGREIVLEVGKIYVIREVNVPDGHKVAERVTVTVTKDMSTEIILSD